MGVILQRTGSRKEAARKQQGCSKDAGRKRERSSKEAEGRFQPNPRFFLPAPPVMEKALKKYVSGQSHPHGGQFGEMNFSG
jgi:hypothetical protein